MWFVLVVASWCQGARRRRGQAASPQSRLRRCPQTRAAPTASARPAVGWLGESSIALNIGEAELSDPGNRKGTAVQRGGQCE